MRGIIQMKRRASHLDINIASESSKEERNPQLFTIHYYLFTEPTGPKMRYSPAVASRVAERSVRKASARSHAERTVAAEFRASLE